MAPTPQTRKSKAPITDFETYSNTWPDPPPDLGEDTNPGPESTGIPLPATHGLRDFRLKPVGLSLSVIAAIQRNGQDLEAKRTAINRGRGSIDYLHEPFVPSSTSVQDAMDDPAEFVQPAMTLDDDPFLEPHMKQVNTRKALVKKAQSTPLGSAASAPITLNDSDDDSDANRPRPTWNIPEVSGTSSSVWDTPEVGVPFDFADNSNVIEDELQADGTTLLRYGEQTFTIVDDEQLSRYLFTRELVLNWKETLDFILDKQEKTFNSLRKAGNRASYSDFSSSIPHMTDSERRALDIQFLLRWESELGIDPTLRYSEDELVGMEPEQFARHFQKVKAARENDIKEQDNSAALKELQDRLFQSFGGSGKPLAQHNRYDLAEGAVDPGEFYDFEDLDSGSEDGEGFDFDEEDEDEDVFEHSDAGQEEDGE